ncbi:MAG TPA: glutathione peroxidase [Elusimicrobiota bacterium]|nr:glutathione peroxidase [Elusimicrobiota bacterium]
MKSLLLSAFILAVSAASPAKDGLYDIPLKDIAGKPATLAAYKGKVLLIVNTASRCGFTPQYAGLEALQKKYAAKGFTVLGFPSNDFGGQEPGSETEIKKFCEVRYGVSFPLFSKVVVLGADKHPLYRWLTGHAPKTGEVGWNFEKFLVDRSGKVVGRFRSPVKPDSPELAAAIEKSL